MNRRDRRAHAKVFASLDRVAGSTAQQVFSEWQAAHGLEGPEDQVRATIVRTSEEAWEEAFRDLADRAGRAAVVLGLALSEDRPHTDELRDYLRNAARSAALRLGCMWCNSRLAEAAAEA